MKSKDLNFEYIEEFVDYVIDEAENDEDNFVTVIAKFDEAKEILKDVMTYDDVNFESLQIESPIMDNYCDEFVLSFWMNDGVLEIGCEKLKNEEGDYANPCGDVVFLFDDCSSKIIPLCEGSMLYFVSIEDECDCDEDCDCECLCDCHKEDKENSSDNFSIKVKCNLDADEALEIIDKMEKRITEINKIFNEMNNMRNLLRF